MAELTLLWEGMRNFGGGADEFTDAVDLAQTQCQRLVNVLIRDKLKARTRPGADPIGAVLCAAEEPQPANIATQGLLYYDTPNTEQLIAAAGGIIWTRNVDAAWVKKTGYSPTVGNAVEMAQGVDKVLLTDGVKACALWDGTNLTACGTTSADAPVAATVLCWHTGRMFASGQSANPDTIYVSNRLDFGNGAWNHTTRSFRVGGGEGDPIRGMKSYVGNWLAVGKENSIWLVYTDPVDEVGDFSAKQPVESVSFGAGLCGPRAWAVYGNDLLFVSPDRQIWSLQRMSSAESQFQLSTPLGVPMQPWLDRINPTKVSGIAVHRYQELVFFAIPLDSSAYNNAVLVWNGRLGCWLGCWEGWTPRCWATSAYGGTRRLVFGDNAGYVEQWKDYASTTSSSTYRDNSTTNYATKLWTRSMAFGDLEAEKLLFNARLRFNAGESESISIQATGDSAQIGSWSKELTVVGDRLGVGRLPFRLAIQSPTVVPVSLRDLAACNEIYLKIESAKGWWELRNLSVSAHPRPMKTK